MYTNVHSRHLHSLSFSEFVLSLRFFSFNESHLILQSIVPLATIRCVIRPSLTVITSLCFNRSPGLLPSPVNGRIALSPFKGPRPRVDLLLSPLLPLSSFLVTGCVHCKGGIMAGSFYRPSFSFILFRDGIKDWGRRDNAVDRWEDRTYLGSRQSSVVY